MFPYRRHQVFTVITTAIIISFGVFSCHNLSLALIYSTGLFPSVQEGRSHQEGGNEHCLPGKPLPGQRGTEAPHGWSILTARAGLSPWQRVAGARTCHLPALFWSWFSQTWCYLSFQLLLAAAHVGLSQPRTQTGWEAAEGSAGTDRGMPKPRFPCLSPTISRPGCCLEVVFPLLQSVPPVTASRRELHGDFSHLRLPTSNSHSLLLAFPFPWALCSSCFLFHQPDDSVIL